MHHLPDVAEIVLCHPNPKANLQWIHTGLMIQNIQDRLGFIGLRRLVVYLADDAREDLFLPKLHDYPQSDLNLGLEIFGDLVGKHPRNRHGQDDIREVVSAGFVQKIMIRKQRFH